MSKHKEKLEKLAADPKLSRLMGAIERMRDRLKEFDVSAIKNEDHLRKLIMDRALATAVSFFNVTVRGKKIPLEDMPKEEQDKHLQNLMMRTLDNWEGPGPVLRRVIARLILDYRLLMRMKDLLPTLPPESGQIKRLNRGILHVQEQLSAGMLFLDAWPMFNDDTPKKEYMARQKKIEEQLFETSESVE